MNSILISLEEKEAKKLRDIQLGDYLVQCPNNNSVDSPSLLSLYLAANNPVSREGNPLFPQSCRNLSGSTSIVRRDKFDIPILGRSN